MFGFAVAVAKARVGEAAGKIVAVVHQVHGAMGFTREHPLHRSTRRLWAWRDEFGGEATWQKRLGAAALAAGGEALAVPSGTAYVDVGTLGGYREAMRLLADTRNEASSQVVPMRLAERAAR